jgi:hypothetical protein
VIIVDSWLLYRARGELRSMKQREFYEAHCLELMDNNFDLTGLRSRTPDDTPFQFNPTFAAGPHATPTEEEETGQGEERNKLELRETALCANLERLGSARSAAARARVKCLSAIRASRECASLPTPAARTSEFAKSRQTVHAICFNVSVRVSY